jgi:hypothetical protein
MYKLELGKAITYRCGQVTVGRMRQGAKNSRKNAGSKAEARNG